jgi:hypothetical protein
MNIHTVKLGLIYILGAALGGLSGAAIADHFFPEWEETPAAEPLQPEFNFSKPTIDDQIDSSMSDMPHVIPADLKKYKGIVKKTDYAAISKKDDKGTLEEVAKELLGEEVVDEVAKPMEPYLISYDTYAVNTNVQEKKVFTYFAVDKVLADENNSEVAFPKSVLGDDALERFGEESDDPDTVYIRDPMLEVDYEVVRVKQSYKVTVLGIPDVKPGKQRNLRNTKKVETHEPDDEE